MEYHKLSTPGEIMEVVTQRIRGQFPIEINRLTVKALLDLNIKNRRVSKESLAAIMDSIRRVGFSTLIGMMGVKEDGTLSDGQKRLIALEKLYEEGFDIPPCIQMVSFGVTMEEFGVTDMTEPRTSRQNRELMYGEKESKAVSGAFALLYRKITNIKKPNVFQRDEFFKKYIDDFISFFPFPGFHSVNGSGSAKTPSAVVAAFIVCYNTLGYDITKKAYELYYSDDADQALVKIRLASAMGVTRKTLGTKEEMFQTTLYAIRGVWKGLRNIRLNKNGFLGVEWQGKNF